MSSRLGIRQFQEAIEQVAGVVRAGARLGVVLDGGSPNVLELEALDRAVVEVQVRELGGAEVGLPADRLVTLDPGLAMWPPDREAVVLRGDLDPPRGQILDRVVGATVAERQLERLEAHRAAQKLVAEADTKNGPLPDQLADRPDHVVERRGIAGAIGEEDQIGIPGQNRVGAGAAWQQ